MLEFYPMDGETDIGFVEVPVEFESWLIAVSGISFEDVSLAVLGEEDGDIELIMDYDDYMNLCDLYYEYDTLGWMILEDPDYVDEINAIPEYDAEGYGEKMTFGTMEWSWETDEEDVDESYINEMIENEIRSTSDSSGNGQLDVDDDEGGSYEVYYDYHHVFSGYNTAETGYYAAETFEAPYAGLGSLFKFGDNQSALGGFTAKELTESSAIHGDFDSASLNYSGKQNLEVRQAEDKCKCNRGDWFRSNCWECYECGEHSTKKECWACSHTTTTNGEWKDGLCWECTDCGEHHTKDRTSHAAETFEASADDYGDMEYIILELLTDAQLEEEYGEVMDDYGIGRDDLPQRLEDDYRTSDEAEYLREKYLKEAETFDAHPRYNIHRFTPRNNPHTKISNTRRKLKQQMWTDTAATVGMKGLLGIIAVVAIGVIAWKKK